MLSHIESKLYYDAFGEKQDKQIYEKIALEKLIEFGDFKTAKSIFEFGCGTGKLASRLLSEILPSDAHYQGIDVSSTMTDLCIKNTKSFQNRVDFKISKGELVFNIENKSIDRFISAYVFDLLEEDDINTAIKEAHRALDTNGFICLAGITRGITVLSQIIEKIWQTLFKLKPSIVGGCRPIEIGRFIDNSIWKLIYIDTIVSYGIPSEVVVAQKC